MVSTVWFANKISVVLFRLRYASLCINLSGMASRPTFVPGCFMQSLDPPHMLESKLATVILVGPVNVDRVGKKKFTWNL